jgi:hypothetical protein
MAAEKDSLAAIVERAAFSSGRDSSSILAAEALEVAPFLHSLFVGLNSLLSRIYSLFGLKNSLFLCTGSFRVSARNYLDGFGLESQRGMLGCPGRSARRGGLLTYISRLSPKFVIFRKAGKFDAWIEVSALAAQLSGHENYSYERLVSTIQGLRTDSIDKSATARDALQKMQASHLDHLAAIDGEHNFKFMLSRDEILSNVVTTVVLSEPPK